MRVRLETIIGEGPVASEDRRALAAVLLRTGVEWELVRPGEGEVALHWGSGGGAGLVPRVELPRYGARQWEGRWRASVEALLAAAARRSAASLEPWLQPPAQPGESHRLAIDLPNVARALLEGWEEEDVPPTDPHGRFDARESMLVRHGLLERPVLDEYCRRLGELLWRLARGAAPPPKPPLTACFSLDIDSAGMFRKAAAARAFVDLGRRRPGNLPAMAVDYLRTKTALLPDPHLSIRVLGEMLEGLDVPATFLVQEGRHHRLDNYDLARAPVLVEQLRAVMANGVHEVGLHGSYSVPRQPAGFVGRQWRGVARCLGSGLAPVFRGHYLQRPRAWGELIPPGGRVVVDSTLGYGAHVGFRRGTAWPFRVANGVVEAAPCTMDTTHRYFARRTAAGALAANEALLDRLAATGGMFVAIFHPNNMEEFLWPGWRDAFVDLVQRVKSDGVEAQSLARGALAMHAGARRYAADLKEHSVS